MVLPPDSRRANYAAATRQAIVDAARDSFSSRGFVATRVDDIAQSARVAPKTVYSVVGGKQGLLQILLDEWINDPLVSNGLSSLRGFSDSREILRVLASSATTMHGLHRGVIRMLMDAAAIDKVASTGMQDATARIQNDMSEVVREIQRRGDLRSDVPERRAQDILFFYFGFTSIPMLRDDLLWPAAVIEQWLTEQACRALLTAEASEQCQ